MSQPVEINPEGVRKAAVEFEGVAETTQRILDTLQTSSESKGEPWGDDKAGEKFAEGEEGYKANRDNTFGSLSQLVAVFNDNAKNLNDAADTFEKNEDEVSGKK